MWWIYMFSFVVHKFWCLENNTAKYEYNVSLEMTLIRMLDLTEAWQAIESISIECHSAMTYILVKNDGRKDRQVQMHIKTVFVNKISPPPQNHDIQVFKEFEIPRQPFNAKTKTICIHSWTVLLLFRELLIKMWFMDKEKDELAMFLFKEHLIISRETWSLLDNLHSKHYCSYATISQMYLMSRQYVKQISW